MIQMNNVDICVIFGSFYGVSMSKDENILTELQ